MAALRILRDLLKTNIEFSIGMALTVVVLMIAALSFCSPYPPMDMYVVPLDLAPCWPHVFGTTSRGQDVFWLLTYAIRNTLLFGLSVALMSRIVALVVGLLAGYKGGWIDRVLMSINDTFIVIPLLPILVLFYFVMRDNLTWGWLALIMALLGWAYEMTTREILQREHFPYVLPIVFSTTLNNINWSIGLEVTLAVLGFTDINTPSIGGMIYWANQHTAMVAGVWWWVAFPVLLLVMVFIGLYLLAVSMNEYIDPRSRLSRMGGAS